MDAVIIQQTYPGCGYKKLVEFTQPRTLEYCKKWDFDYQYVDSDVDGHDMKLGAWAKIKLIRDALQKYKYIVWMDADCMIGNFVKNLRGGCKGIGVASFDKPYTHYNVGMVYVENCVDAARFLKEWQNRFPGPGRWREQAVFNAMAMEPEYHYIVNKLDRKYNSCASCRAHVEDAFVEGFHGAGTVEQRYRLMVEFMDTLI